MAYETDLETIGRRADAEVTALQTDLAYARESLTQTESLLQAVVSEREGLLAEKAALVAERNELAVTVAVLQARIAELEGTEPPPPLYEPVLPIFDVRDYGARGGEVDDALAFRDAFAAAHEHGYGTVSIPPGPYRIATAWNMPAIRTNDWLGQTSPTVHRAGTIVVSGYGATIKYDGVIAPATRTERITFLQSHNPGGSWTTYGKLRVQGLTFDNGDRIPSGDCGTIVWVQGEQTSVEDVEIRDCKTVNVRRRTAANQNGCIHGIMLHSSQVNRAQAHTSFIRRVTVEDCDIEAQGKAIDILCPKTGEPELGANKVLVTGITIARTRTDNNGFCGTGIHLGSYAAGGTCRVIDCICTDSTDNLVEIDAFNDVEVRGCQLSKAQSGVGFTWFSYPFETTTPSYRVIDCHYGGGNGPYWPKTVDPEPPRRSACAFGQVTLGAAGTQLAGREWGHFLVEGCSASSGDVDTYGIHQPAIKFDAPLTSVMVRDCDLTDVVPAGVSGALVYVRQRATTARVLPLTIRGVRFRGSPLHSYAALPRALAYVAGNVALDTDMAA